MGPPPPSVLPLLPRLGLRRTRILLWSTLSCNSNNNNNNNSGTDRYCKKYYYSCSHYSFWPTSSGWTSLPPSMTAMAYQARRLHSTTTTATSSLSTTPVAALATTGGVAGKTRFSLFPFFSFILLFSSLLAVIVIPPKSVLPSCIFSVRVLLEGTTRVLRCVLVGSQIFFDYQRLRLQLRLRRWAHPKPTPHALPLTGSTTKTTSSSASESNSRTRADHTIMPQTPPPPLGEEETEDCNNNPNIKDNNVEEEYVQKLWDEVHIRSARRLVSLAEANGGLYVKTGQIFANMSHVLPLPYCEILSSLQDKVQPRSFDEIRAVLEADLGKKGGKDGNGLDDWLEYIHPTPLAAASLSQVHRARRRHLPDPNITTTTSTSSSSSSPSASSSSGSLPPSPFERQFTKEVVIKIQYIDVAARFAGDMLAINAMLMVTGWLYPGFDFSEIVRKLQNTVEAELDFRKEAANSIRMGRELWKRGYQDRVVCPTIHPDVQTSRVLVMNYIDGVKITDKKGIAAMGMSLKETVGLFLDCVGYQLFVHGFFHADPHAGNVLVRPRPRSPSSFASSSSSYSDSGFTGATMKGGRGDRDDDGSGGKERKRKGPVHPQVVLLDFGLCSELSQEHREELCSIWIAAVTHDDKKLKKLAQQYSIKKAVPTSFSLSDAEVSSSCSSLSAALTSVAASPPETTSSTSTSSPVVVVSDASCDRSGGGVNYSLFASCFLQYPYHLFPKDGQSSLSLLWQNRNHNKTAAQHGALASSAKVKQAIHRQVADQMMEVQGIVGALPKEYALVLRVLLATRAVNQEVGIPVNRHRCFLQHALEGRRVRRSGGSDHSPSFSSCTIFPSLNTILRGSKAGWSRGEVYWMYVKLHWSDMYNRVIRLLLRLYVGEEIVDEILILG